MKDLTWAEMIDALEYRLRMIEADKVNLRRVISLRVEREALKKAIHELKKRQQELSKP